MAWVWTRQKTPRNERTLVKTRWWGFRRSLHSAPASLTHLVTTSFDSISGNVSMSEVKTNTHRQPSRARACGKRRHPAWCCWGGCPNWGRFSQGYACSPPATPAVAVARGCRGATCAFAVPRLCPAWVALCCPGSARGCLFGILGPSVRCFAVIVWCWARSLAFRGLCGKGLEKSVFCSYVFRLCPCVHESERVNKTLSVGLGLHGRYLPSSHPP